MSEIAMTPEHWVGH